MAAEIYPVVHVKDTEQAVEQSEVAFELGADGVYLIDHTNPQPSQLIEAYSAVDEAHGDKFIGLNFLQFPNGFMPFKHLQILADRDEIRRLPNAIWTDNASLSANEVTFLRNADPKLKDIRYLGGIAFKYTPGHTEDPQLAARQALALSGHVDVVTTSGLGTGQAANPAKIIAMHEAIKPQRLAVASGISEENIDTYRDHVEEILVSTSVETSPGSGVFEPTRLQTLIALAHQG